MVYKQHPLGNHFWAFVASEAALAAGEQGKFLEMDELIFSRQRQITKMLQEKAVAMGKTAQDMRSEDVQREVFIDLAGELGLDTGRIRQALEARTYQAQIRAETQEAVRVGATGTPASFINGRYMRGAQPFEKFRAEVQKEIDWARNGNRPAFATGTSVRQLRAQNEGQRRGPDPNKVYPIAAGRAPFDGPAGAQVTVLHYLDYQ